VKHIAADRKDPASIAAALEGTDFDVVYDMNGREQSDCEPIIGAVGDLEQYIFCSSAGVYEKSFLMPHMETDPGDFNSRHKGKLYTEDYLAKQGVPFTSIRPVYIYGPLNYNPVEEWFFHRLAAGRPVPIPNGGQQITQLGHVKDLATAFVKCLDNPKAINQIYNISGERLVTFNGIAEACAEAMGVEAEIVNYETSEVELPSKPKAFPMRDQHFFTSIAKAKADLGWEPEFDLVEGLRDSYEKDYALGRYCADPDFTCDDIILAKKKALA